MKRCWNVQKGQDDGRRVQRLPRALPPPAFPAEPVRLSGGQGQQPEAAAVRLCVLPDDRSRRAVELSEMFADGLVTQEEVEAAGRAIVAAFPRKFKNIAVGYAVADAAFGSFNSSAVIASLETVAKGAEGAAHCALLRDIYGNPFHPAAVEGSWLAWGEGTVVKLAQAVYQDRAFDRLPVLADALEEAGCTDQNILEHCRASGPHVRGCWVVDLLLGRAAKAGSWIHRLREPPAG